MRNRTFLPMELFYGLVFLVVYGFFKFKFLVAFLIFILSSLILFIFRRKNIPFRETQKLDGEIYLSPVFGKVQSIRKNVTLFDGTHYGCEIRLMVSFLDSKGLYLPTDAEANYLKANKGIQISRLSESQAFYRPIEEVAHTDLVLSLKKGTQSLLRFVDCEYGTRPVIWLKSGDIGRGAACFGYYPFGGSLLIYLPVNSDILVYENERVIPGQTVLAVLKEV